MKKSILLFLVLPFLFSCSREKPTKEEIVQYITSTPLTFTETCIVTRNVIQDHKNLEGKTSKAVIPVKAVITASLNLAKIQGITVDKEEQIVHISLPKPVIRINFPEAGITNAIYCTDVSRSTFFESEMYNYRPQAMELIQQSLLESDISTQIQRNAAFALASKMQKPKFRNMSYKIEVVKYSDEDILNFIAQ